MKLKRIVLASSSPRRHKLLKDLGITFIIDPSRYEENMSLPLKPEALVKHLSLQKAKDVAKKYDDAVIIAADTFVVLGNDIFGKPKNLDDAKNMLRKLRGTIHHVVTGYTIIDTTQNKTITASEMSKIHLQHMTDTDIQTYVETFKPLDKAGSYAIQEIDQAYIKKIEGNIDNILGLPLKALRKSLQEVGITI